MGLAGLALVAKSKLKRKEKADDGKSRFSLWEGRDDTSEAKTGFFNRNNNDDDDEDGFLSIFPRPLGPWRGGGRSSIGWRWWWISQVAVDVF